MKKNIQKRKRMFSWMNPKLEVRNTKKYGKGVFAKRGLKKDEVLAVFGGYIMTLKEENSLPKAISDLSLQISDNFVLGPNDVNSLQSADFFNHNCEPNAGFRGQIFLVAMQNIMSNEQVCFDYAMTVGGKRPYSFKCLCGSKNCRKVITNTDWGNPELQKIYKGYFQWYLQEKINKSQQTL